MKNKLLDQLFKRKNLFFMLFIILFGYGIYSYIMMPKQEMPEIDTPFMTLVYTVPGVDAISIEESIIKDTEKIIMTYPDVTEVRSFIYDNYAISYLLYSFSTDDPDQLSIDIYTKIMELELSDTISDISYFSQFDDPHIIYSLHSDTLSETELVNYASKYKNELLTISEIKEVEIFSSFNEEVVITLNQDMLDLLGLSITDVYQIIYYNHLNIPLGGINTTYGTISISGYEELESVKDLEDLTIIPEIPTVSPKITLKDISTITLEDTSTKKFSFNDEKTVFLSLYFDEDIDFTKMGVKVTDLKDAFLTDEANDDLAIDELLFLPDYVSNQINDVFYSLLIAIGVVMVIVLIGIGFRNSILIILTIPVIVFGTVGILYLANFELHKLTIVGMIVAIGIMVDNSIVITESIKYHIDRGLDKKIAAKSAILDNFAPILSSTLTTIAAFIVLVLLPGFLGEVVSSMPLTVIITITLSFIVSMTLSPLLAFLFLKPSKKPKTVSIHETRIKKMIRNTIKYPLLWLTLSFVTLGVVTFFTFKIQPLDLYPNDERGVIYIDYENDQLGDIDSTTSLNTDLVDVFKDNPHVLNYASSIGGNLPTFHFSAEMISNLPQYGRIYLNLDYQEDDLLVYVKELEAAYKNIDNAKISVQTLELSPPIAPVRVTLSGADIKVVDSVSTSVFNDIIELDSLKSYNVTSNIESNKFSIEYDKTLMANSFITKAQIDSIIAINLNGYDLDIFAYNDDTINISLNSDIVSVPDILSLSVYSDILDMSFPLSTFITINQEIDYSVISRFNNENVAYIDLYYSDEASLLELEKDVKDIVSHHDTTGVTVTYGGENEMFTEISGDLIRASIIAIVLIYIIIYIQFNSFIKPLIVFLTIPLSFTGSFLFLMIFNSPITATSLVGMVSLIGVTVNTGILLVEYISRNHDNGEDIVEACVNAVYLRFRPIMLTGLTTILGLIPLLITGGNFFRPMAITFMGGMVTSTLITLFLVPSVYKLVYTKYKKTT